jgi:hypothetical protein
MFSKGSSLFPTLRHYMIEIIERDTTSHAQHPLILIQSYQQMANMCLVWLVLFSIRLSLDQTSIMTFNKFVSTFMIHKSYNLLPSNTFYAPSRAPWRWVCFYAPVLSQTWSSTLMMTGSIVLIRGSQVSRYAVFLGDNLVVLSSKRHIPVPSRDGNENPVPRRGFPY